MLREDKLPFCVSGCPMKAIYMGEMKSDMATNGTDIVKLSRFLAENNAFRWKEELGTQPRVWFLPGHGEVFSRRAQDDRPLMKPVWSWGGEGFDKKIGVWPWGKE
jgi:molybdopterin-containing oxidoreductase family iron-sulfur binding subunit